jgi:hypothetical protein
LSGEGVTDGRQPCLCSESEDKCWWQVCQYVALLGITADVVSFKSFRQHQPPPQPNSCASQARSQCFSQFIGCRQNGTNCLLHLSCDGPTLGRRARPQDAALNNLAMSKVSSSSFRLAGLQLCPRSLPAHTNSAQIPFERRPRSCPTHPTVSSMTTPPRAYDRSCAPFRSTAPAHLSPVHPRVSQDMWFAVSERCGRSASHTPSPRTPSLSSRRPDSLDLNLMHDTPRSSFYTFFLA